MCAMQNFTQHQQQNQQQIQQPPVQPPPPVYRFRWGVFFGIPLTIALFAFVIKNIDPSFEFRDCLNKWEIIEHTKFTRLVCIAVLCLASLIIAKLFINKQD